MKNLSRVEKNLLRAEAIINSVNVTLSVGTELFLTKEVASTAIVQCNSIGVALGAFSWVLIVAADVIELIFWFVHDKAHKSVSEYVTQVGIPLLKPTNKPSQSWLDKHALPEIHRK